VADELGGMVRPRCLRAAGGRDGPAPRRTSGSSCSRGSVSAKGRCPGGPGAYHLLGRRTFLTTGDKESRAWSFRAGATRPECAGVIHSDLQRGSSGPRSSTGTSSSSCGSWAKAKAAGGSRLEGKDYQVADGDVLEIRFNV
jgi:hypothetical protein